MFNTPESSAQVAPVALAPACDPDLAAAYVTALTGSADAVMDWRCLHDKDKSLPGYARRGTLSEVWPWVTGMNAAGYGCFVNVNETDGEGRSKDNITTARAVWVDLDGIDARQQYEAAAAWSPAPSFAVQTSPERWHVYWLLAPDCPLDKAESLNRRARARFNGDKNATDLARVLRLPGTYHLKAVPTLVTCHQLAGYGRPVDWQALDAALADQPDHDGTGERHELGTPSLAAPSLDWLKRALDLTDPNMLDRGEWISLTAATKQAGWSLTDEATLRGLWADMCARYEHNDPAENEKQWRSIRESQLGWSALVARIPSLKAEVAFGPSGPPPLPPGASDTRQPVAANDQAPTRRPITATPYSWRDPRTIPPRPWLLGRWALMGEVTTILAPGGTGKSTLGAGIGLSMTTGRALLGQKVYDGPHAVWLLNLEDGIEELERQVGAATIKHSIDRDECGDRMFLDSGIVQPLCTATETRDGFTIDESTFEHLAATIHQSCIRAVVVDPFISSHTVSEVSNEAIDAIVKRWKRLAQETDCAVVLVHHTKKLGGREATAEDGRGAVALRDASRVVLALNPMTEADGKKLGVFDPTARRSIVRVDMGKANRAPADRATWFRIEGQCLNNATPSRPADNVGVAVEWKRPDLLHGFTSDHLRALQERLGAGALRENAQATDWVGKAITEIAGLDLENEEHKARVKAVLAAWIDDGSLAIEHRDNGKGSESPFVVCGRSVDAVPGQMDPR